MNDVVERVARAIRFATNPLDGDPIGVMIHNYDFLQADTVDEQIKLVDGVCAVIARAAIEAMREPTEAMLAAADEVFGMPWTDVIPPGVNHSHYITAHAWSAMISAALADASPDIGKEG